MIDDIGGVTSKLVKLALDASLLKHEVIANNIANANTPGFQPQRVSFENILLDIEHNRTPEMDKLLGNELDELKHAIDNNEIVKNRDTAKVELDVEMADMAENVVRYRALLEGLSKRGSIIKMAISQQGDK